jgi:hypothetical protein
MATGAALKTDHLTPSELDAVLEQARVEGWRELAIFGPSFGGRFVARGRFVAGALCVAIQPTSSSPANRRDATSHAIVAAARIMATMPAILCPPCRTLP